MPIPEPVPDPVDDRDTGSAPGPAPGSRAIPVLIAAAVTQFAAGMGFWTFNLLAPELAAETGLDERDFGLWITFTFIGAFLSSGFTGAIVRRYGGAGAMIRLFAWMGGALLIVLTGTWWGTMAGAFLFGLGYAPQGPVGMTLVAQTARPEQRGLFLALRHSAVPLAGTVAGRVLPPLMIWAGWQAGVLSIVGCMALAIVFVLFETKNLKVEATPPPARPLGAQLRGLFSIPPNLRFLWSAGLVFALTQTAVTTFAYLYLLEVAKLSPVTAGIFSSNLLLTSVIGRPILGWLTDRLGSAQKVLAGIATVTVISALSLMQVGPETPTWVLIPLSIGCGISGQCWNSVFVTAMSFRVAPGELAEMNGRAFAFLSIGWLAAPPIVWTLIEATGGYDAALMGVAGLNALVGIVLVAFPRQGRD